MNLAFLILLASLYGKDPCSNIKKHADKLRGFTSFIRPNGPIVAQRWETGGNATLTLNFILTSQSLPANISERQTGLYILFEDGTRFHLDTVTIREDIVLNIPVFSYQLNLNDTLVELFKNKMVSTFELGGLTKDVRKTATLIPVYLECLQRMN